MVFAPLWKTKIGNEKAIKNPLINYPKYESLLHESPARHSLHYYSPKPRSVNLFFCLEKILNFGRRMMITFLGCINLTFIINFCYHYATKSEVVSLEYDMWLDRQTGNFLLPSFLTVFFLSKAVVLPLSELRVICLWYFFIALQWQIQE